MKRILTFAALFIAAAIATPAVAADARPYRHDDRERAASRLERQGDRIDARLDRQGDRIERHFDRLAVRAEALGREHQADRLRARGEHIARRLDRRGDRIEAHYDRRAEQLDRFDHRGKNRYQDRHEHAYAPIVRDRWCGNRLALQLNGLGIFWSHRH